MFLNKLTKCKALPTQKALHFLFFLILLSPSNLSAQTQMDLPQEYLDFIAPHNGESFSYPYRTQVLYFWSLDELNPKNESLVQEGRIQVDDMAFANTDDGSIIFIKKEKRRPSTKIYHLDEFNSSEFLALSFKQLKYGKITDDLINDLETKDYTQIDLSQIQDSPGSLFEYAFQLQTSIYDDNYSEEQNIKAREIFLAAVEAGHPEAARQLANYHFFKDEVNNKKVILWREKAIELGSKEDRYDLADFLIDYEPKQIKKAIELLEGLLNDHWYKDRAALKLSRIYTRGTGGLKNLKKGIEIIKICAANKNYNCMSDLAFFYYQGMGVEKNIQKAYDLLVEADKIATKKFNPGAFDAQLKMLKKELENQKQ